MAQRAQSACIRHVGSRCCELFSTFAALLSKNGRPVVRDMGAVAAGNARVISTHGQAGRVSCTCRPFSSGRHMVQELPGRLASQIRQPAVSTLNSGISPHHESGQLSVLWSRARTASQQLMRACAVLGQAEALPHTHIHCTTEWVPCRRQLNPGSRDGDWVMRHDA